jgi:hypothetical protein
MLRCDKTIIICEPEHKVRCVNERIKALAKIIEGEGEYIVTLKRNDPLMFFGTVFEYDGIYKIWDFDDNCNTNSCEAKKMVSDHRCKLILKSQIRPNFNPKFRPFFYFAQHGRFFDDRVEILRKIPKTKDELFWRGRELCKGGTQERGKRKSILEAIKHLINKDYHTRKPKEEYYREVASSKMILSLPGLGKACHREFEAFAVGTPVIMPEFTNVYHVNLVPNYHYVSVAPHDGESMAEAIERRYHETHKDEDLLDFVATNAMAYYDRYCRFDVSVEWFKTLLFDD